MTAFLTWLALVEHHYPLLVAIVCGGTFALLALGFIALLDKLDALV